MQGETQKVEHYLPLMLILGSLPKGLRQHRLSKETEGVEMNRNEDEAKRPTLTVLFFQGLCNVTRTELGLAEPLWLAHGASVAADFGLTRYRLGLVQHG